MIRYDRILEDNISRLLKRAYQPAPCRQEFREACLQRILRILARPRGWHNLSLVTKIAIAAGVILTIGVFAWRTGVFERGGTTGLPGVSDGIVATPGTLLKNDSAQNKPPNGAAAGVNDHPASQPGAKTTKTGDAEPIK